MTELISTKIEYGREFQSLELFYFTSLCFTYYCELPQASRSDGRNVAKQNKVKLLIINPPK